MQNYHIYAHADKSAGRSKANPQYKQDDSKTAAVTSDQKEKLESRHSGVSMAFTGAKALYIANRINTYVGELTENTVTARRVQVGLTYAGMIGLAVSNPMLGLTAIASYTANAAINYGIKVYKENLSANYMKTLSGGTVKMGR